MSKYLAERMRPKSLDDFLGQKHLVGEGNVLRKMIEMRHIYPFILWGPSGVGKTTLVQIISKHVNIPFLTLSAVDSGINDIKKVVSSANNLHLFNNVRPILFIDEIHRYNKIQQNFLLTILEKEIITLIGTTTENPSFEIINPLLSRCHVYVLDNLSDKDLLILMYKALKEDIQLQNYIIKVKETTTLLRFADGDARKLLNILELVIETEKNGKEKVITITDSMIRNYLQKSFTAYSKKSQVHYDIISAFIKSIRGSDPDAAIYWLARMLIGGEDPKFIARRLVISASEDIGLSNPNALLLANACFDSVSKIGMPESKIILAETTIYLATCPKSNSAYEAIETALKEVACSGNISVPLHLRNAPNQLMKDLDYGKNYKCCHHYKNDHIQQIFLPQKIKNKKFWVSKKNLQELKMQKYIDLKNQII